MQYKFCQHITLELYVNVRFFHVNLQLGYIDMKLLLQVNIVTRLLHVQQKESADNMKKLHVISIMLHVNVIAC